jgi:hypothetical protein
MALLNLFHGLVAKTFLLSKNPAKKHKIFNNISVIS